MTFGRKAYVGNNSGRDDFLIVKNRRSNVSVLILIPFCYDKIHFLRTSVETFWVELHRDRSIVRNVKIVL